MGRIARWVGDFIESDPRAHIYTSRALVKLHRGVLTDIEGVPVEQRLLLRLLNGDYGVRVLYGLCGRICSDWSTLDVQAACAQPIRYIRKGLPREIRVGAQVVHAGSSHACSHLHGVYCVQRHGVAA